MAHHFARSPVGGRVAAACPRTRPADDALCRPRPVCRGDLPAPRRPARPYRGRGRFGLFAPACRQPGALRHLVRGVLLAPLPDELRSPDGRSELRAVHRQYDLDRGYGGDSRRLCRFVGRPLPRRLREVQAARLPECPVARVPFLRRGDRLDACGRRPTDGAHAADARTAVGALRL